MFNRKILTALVLVSFALQSCSQGVAPTPGLNTLNDGQSEGEQLDILKDNLCLLADEGADEDHDGVCDATDPNPTVAGCPDAAVDPFCVGDEFNEPHKNHVGTYIFGSMAAIAVAWVGYAAFTGDWTWWSAKKDDTPSNEFKDIVRIEQNAEAKELSSSETFFKHYSEGVGEIWGTINYEIKIGNMYWFPPGDMTQKLGKGSLVKLCMTGKLGIATDAVNKKAVVSYHIAKKPYTDKKDLKLTPANFDIMCKNTQGVFLGYQIDASDPTSLLYVNAYPISTFNTGELTSDTGSEYIVDVNYNFDSIPGSPAFVPGLKYHRENPLDNSKTMDYVISSLSSDSQTNYIGCADDVCRIANLLGSGPDNTEVKTTADPAAVAERISQVDDYLF